MKSNEYRFDIKTVSEANQREHWSGRNRRKKAQQKEFSTLWYVLKSCGVKISLPATITFTRYSCKMLDTDNLAGSFKHIQDQLAREIGVDDGGNLVVWRYAQEQIKKREHYFTVTVEK